MNIKRFINFVIGFFTGFKGVFRYLLNRRYDVAFYSKEYFHDDWIVSSLKNLSDSNLKILYMYSNETSISDVKGVDIIKASERALCFVKSKIIITAVSGISRNTISNYVVELIHMPHSFVSLHMAYSADTFDAYDVIFSCGPHHDKEIDALNKVRRLTIKSVPIGYGRLDHYLSKTDDNSTPSERESILIAPSWAPGNIIDNIAKDLIRSLIDRNYDVYLRPHPQHWKHFPRKLKNLISAFENNDRFHLNTQHNSAPLFTCNMLVTDFSGIAFDFYFIKQRPIVFVDSQLKVNNTEIGLYSLDPIEVSIRDKIGVISAHSLKDILDKIFSNNTRALRIDKMLYNYGDCSLAVANYINHKIKK